MTAETEVPRHAAAALATGGAEQAAPGASVTKVATGCEWKQSEDGQWDTSCGGTFEFVNGDPAMNGAKFCCYCGLCLDQLPYEDEEEDDEK